MQAILVEFTANGCFYPAVIEILRNIHRPLSVCVSTENLTDDFRFIFIDIEPAILVDLIPKTWITAVGQALGCIDLSASVDLLGKLRRVVFRHAFQDTFDQDAGCILRNILPGGEDTHTVLLEPGFIDGTVVTISGEAVQLIDKDTLECVLLAVLNHPLKIGSVVGCTALRPVDVLADHGVLMGLGVLVANLQLTLNRLLRLRVTGKPGIDDYIHFVTSCIV